jgi:hypothetical protein
MLRGAAGRVWPSLKLLVITVNFAIDEFRSSTVSPSRSRLGRHCPGGLDDQIRLLVYLGLIPLVTVIIFSGFVIWLALFIFTAILYFVDAEGAGAEIFNKASPVIFALVGTIVGYIFGTRAKQ